MIRHPSNSGVWVFIALAGLAHAHIGAYHPAMYCINGTDPSVNPYNNDQPSTPLYQLSYNQFWMHQVDGCAGRPPEEGVFLDLQPGGNFTVELAENRAFTSLSPYAKLTDWGDGEDHPDDYSITNLGGLSPTTSGCIPSPNLHAQNQSMAAGTSFAISYNSDINRVTPENLVVFTVKYNTPWKRVTTYDIPSALPPCDNCTCTFNWIANGCGQRNIFMFPLACRVFSGSTSPGTIGNPKPAVWCEDDPSKCVSGPKQILIYDQAEANNIEVDGYDNSGELKTPGYNMKCGFSDGAQNDIFVGSATGTGPSTGSSTATGTGPSTGSSTATGTGPSTGSSTPVVCSTTPTSNISPGSGTPTLPSLAPASSLPAGPSASANSTGARKRSTENTAIAGLAAHLRRMVKRREQKKNF